MKDWKDYFLQALRMIKSELDEEMLDGTASLAVAEAYTIAEEVLRQYEEFKLNTYNK